MFKFFKWLPALLLFMPRQMASISTAILLLISLLFLIWLPAQSHYIAGQVKSISAITGTNSVIAQISNPLSFAFNGNENSDRLIKVELTPEQKLSEKDSYWIFALGEKHQQIADYQLLLVDEIIIINNIAGTNNFASIIKQTSIYPAIAIALGALFLIAGPLLGRIPSAIISGLLLGATTWHGLYIARFINAITLIEPLITTASATMVLVGLIIGLRSQRDTLNKITEHLIMILLLLFMLPDIMAYFSISSPITSIVLLILSILSPIIAYAILGGYFLSIGFAATPLTAMVIMVLAFFIVLIMHNAYGNNIQPRLNTRYKVQPTTGQTELSSLL